MTASFETAVDEILTVFKTVWDTTGHFVDYPGVKYGGTNAKVPPDDSTAWARVTIQHTPGGPPSLSGANGQVLYNRQGLLTVQIFTAVGNGFGEGYQLAKTVADSFEGQDTPSAVWFRNLRMNEIGRTGDWLQVNVLVDFTYDERK